jgi:putative hydrolase of the HAD superfamily
MYEAVIFDFGGVFTESPFHSFARYERDNDLPADIIKRINSVNHLTNAWARFERGELTIDEFDRAFADEALALGYYVSGREVIALLAGAPRPEMHEALVKLRVRYKTGCITNNVPSLQVGGVQIGSIYKQETMSLFDHVIESSKAGVRKPDLRIYEMMCNALAVPSHACIYLDDLGVNLKPARAMGMHTIKVESGAQAIAELEAATGMTLG